MVLKDRFKVLLFFALLAWSSAALADQYRPDEFLKLDLAQAVLSPKPLGPPTQFEPVAVEAKSDPTGPVTGETANSDAGATNGDAAAVSSSGSVAKAHAVIAAPVHLAKHHGAVRTRLARKHGNPLDAQAFDTRIQVWPCRSGGICNWQR
jgi:hypothetical protein